MNNEKKTPVRLRKECTVVVVIDLQERLIPAMREGEKVRAQAAKLVQGAELLGVPVLTTQQYTKGLGETVEDVKAAYAEFSYIEKSAFSAMADEGFADALKESGRGTVLLCGVEAHVCVLQTALDMLEQGYAVLLVTDAISSRKEMDEAPAVKRMIHAGVVPTTVESALFELLDNDSKSDVFKGISKLIK
ncbi:MAG: hydrolase [Clostridiales Family XIII bacterium]|jgi:nicotinamidase-related amidase|nr:hydrolase [Clostridiales Family XIII bacterium]